MKWRGMMPASQGAKRRCTTLEIPEKKWEREVDHKEKENEMLK